MPIRDNQLEAIMRKDIDDQAKYEEIRNLIESQYAEKSRPVMATEIRKRLVQLGLTTLAETVSIAFPEITQRLKEERERKMDCAPINVTTETFATLLDWRESDSRNKKLAYLLLVSGVRANELLMKDNFVIDDNKLYARKILKKKNYEQSRYEIKLVPEISPQTFVEMLNATLANESSAPNSILRAIERTLKELNLTPHSLRSLYLLYHQNVGSFKGKRSRTAIKDLLNHNLRRSGDSYDCKYEVEGLLNLLSSRGVDVGDNNEAKTFIRVERIDDEPEDGFPKNIGAIKIIARNLNINFSSRVTRQELVAKIRIAQKNKKKEERQQALKKMKVADLKKLATEKGVPKKGMSKLKKSELIDEIMKREP